MLDKRGARRNESLKKVSKKLQAAWLLITTPCSDDESTDEEEEKKDGRKDVSDLIQYHVLLCHSRS
jgi:hypothetical protein